MRVLIADDEAPARARLRALLDELGGHEVVGEAASGEQVVRLCQSLVVDVVLLDIRMPGMTGLEAARILARRAQPPAVVFTTAYDAHALAAFEADASDYLLKPIRCDRLARALDKVVPPSHVEPAFLSATLRGMVRRIPLDAVVYLRAGSKYVEVGCDDTSTALIEDSLVSIEERFPGRFVRVHRNALVDPAQIIELGRNTAGHPAVRLRGGPELEVSRRHLAELRRLLRC